MNCKTFPYTDWMTLKEWKKFVKNYKKEEGDIILKVFLSYYYQNKSFGYMIASAFTWNNTLEGVLYWSDISDRTGPVKQNV